jgi:hypothetical protein
MARIARVVGGSSWAPALHHPAGEPAATDVLLRRSRAPWTERPAGSGRRAVLRDVVDGLELFAIPGERPIRGEPMLCDPEGIRPHRTARDEWHPTAAGVILRYRRLFQ